MGKGLWEGGLLGRCHRGLIWQQPQNVPTLLCHGQAPLPYLGILKASAILCRMPGATLSQVLSISCFATHPRTPDAASAGAHRSTWTHPPPGNNPKGIQGSASQCRDLKRNRWPYSVGGLGKARGGGCWRALPQAAQIPPSSLKTPSSLLLLLLRLLVVVVMEGHPRCQSGKRFGLCPGSPPPPHQKNQSMPVAA